MTFSKRIQKLSNSDQYFTTDSTTKHEIDFSSHKGTLKLSLEINSGKISNFSYLGEVSKLQKAIFEAFGRLNKDTFFWSIKGIDQREMRNYLQDFNDQKAFSQEFEDEFNETLSVFPLFLSKIFVGNVLAGRKNYQYTAVKGSEMGQMLGQMKSLFDDIISPLIGPECPLVGVFQWDAPYLTLISKAEHRLPEILLDSIHEIYSSEFQIYPLKVVAVERKSI
jgi:hypothetical protein